MTVSSRGLEPLTPTMSRFHGLFRKRLLLEHLSLWQISQVLSLTSFEKTPVNSLFLYEKWIPEDPRLGKQLSFLGF